MQLLELARENAELKGQLSRLLREAERIQRLLADRSIQIPSDESEDLGEEIA
ncbi:MAG TPA: hypothetical protein VJX92_22445 [Methylomirabilota bacterium]|nr:hypothetical protein [Methylomirabilota bacterium]